ncbi:MAG TPA: serine hydrolase domain-containing protein [Terracidiphilus sp.]|nr:serine hydrolase domain-containing protein [Terracidiphilus sp.]
MSITEPIHAALSKPVDNGELAGAAALISRGDSTEVVCAGVRDLKSRLPIERDTIFRIASMTKPVTSALALTLFDEGRFRLEDPITRFAPEFERMRVLGSPEGPLEDSRAADRPITFEDLLTHRAGFTYSDFHRGPIGNAYAEALGKDIDNELTPDEWIGRLARLPLIDQPGNGFHYGHSTDLLGFLIERIEDAPLGDVLECRICAPLGMKDTGFSVPKGKRNRRAGPCGFDADARPIALETVPGGHALPERPPEMTFVSGGQGLWSTLDDYLAFARIFAGGGKSGGVQLLQPHTLSMMASNQLTAGQRASAKMFGRPLFATGHAYGLGVAVVTEPEKADPMRCGGGAGAVGWPGAYGGWWQADPNDGSVMIFLAHNMVELSQMAAGIGLSVWGAITEFQALGTAALRQM